MLNWGVMSAGGIAYVFCLCVAFYKHGADSCRCAWFRSEPRAPNHTQTDLSTISVSPDNTPATRLCWQTPKSMPSILQQFTHFMPSG